MILTEYHDTAAQRLPRLKYEVSGWSQLEYNTRGISSRMTFLEYKNQVWTDAGKLTWNNI